MTILYYSEPKPAQVSSAEQLEQLLLTTPGIKVEIDLSRWGRRAETTLEPRDAWLMEADGPSRECAMEREAERVARCKRNGVSR